MTPIRSTLAASLISSSDQFDNAIADYDAALKDAPKVASSWYVTRGWQRKQKKGDNAGGNVDMAAGKAIEVKIAEKLAGYGVK